jgi:hypothetical protein
MFEARMKKLRREVNFPVRKRVQLSCSSDQIKISAKSWQVDFTLIRGQSTGLTVEVFSGHKSSPQFLCPLCNKSTYTLRGLEHEPLSLGCPSCRKANTSLSRYGIRGRGLIRQLADVRAEIEELGGMEIQSPLYLRPPDDCPAADTPRIRNLLAKEKSLVWRIKLGEFSSKKRALNPVSGKRFNEVSLMSLIDGLDKSTVDRLEAIADGGGSIVELSAELNISVRDWVYMCQLSPVFARYSEYLYTKTQAAQLAVCREAITRPAAARALTRWLGFHSALDRMTHPH